MQFLSSNWSLSNSNSPSHNIGKSKKTSLFDILRSAYAKPAAENDGSGAGDNLGTSSSGEDEDGTKFVDNESHSLPEWAKGLPPEARALAKILHRKDYAAGSDTNSNARSSDSRGRRQSQTRSAENSGSNNAKTLIDLGGLLRR